MKRDRIGSALMVSFVLGAAAWACAEPAAPEEGAPSDAETCPTVAPSECNGGEFPFRPGKLDCELAVEQFYVRCELLGMPGDCIGSSPEALVVKCDEDRCNPGRLAGWTCLSDYAEELEYLDCISEACGPGF